MRQQCWFEKEIVSDGLTEIVASLCFVPAAFQLLNCSVLASLEVIPIVHQCRFVPLPISLVHSSFLASLDAFLRGCDIEMPVSRLGKIGKMRMRLRDGSYLGRCARRQNQFFWKL